MSPLKAPSLILLLLVVTLYAPLTSTADPTPAEPATEIYDGVSDDWSLDVPKDKKRLVPVFRELMSSKLGAGAGARAFNTSLNLSTAVPIGVSIAKSVKRPSA